MTRAFVAAGLVAALGLWATGCATGVADGPGDGDETPAASSTARTPADPAVAGAVSKVSASLIAKVARGDEMSVVVLLDAAPDGSLPERLAEEGAHATETYRHFPVIKTRLSSARALAMLDADARVVSVVEDEPMEHFLTESTALVRQPVAFADGKAGAGTSVAVLDTGVDYTRAAFGACVAAGAPGCKVSYAADFATEDGARDAHGHGTNVAAIVLGVAPATKILSLDVFDGGWAYTSVILTAIDWVIEHRAEHNIVAMNMSFGGGLYSSPCTVNAIGSAISAARSAGVLSAVASGNDGSSTSLASPACAPSAVSVGAVYDASFGPVAFSGCSDAITRADGVTCFSNSASFLTVLAPGAFVTAGGVTYAGTSQAAPHVAGAFAVLAATYPGSTPTQTLARVTRSGAMITDARNGVTKPRLDVAAASCSAIVTPTSRAVGAAGGDVTLQVATGPSCPWSTRARVDWLSAALGSRGTGSMVVHVAPNSGPARKGAITVARRTVWITQAAP